MNARLFPDLIVNGETVPHAAVAAETQHQQAPKGKPGIAWRKAATAMAIRTLLLQEAARLGIRAAPAELGAGRHESREEALIRGVLEARIAAAKIADADIHAHWARDPSRFRAPPLWEVAHILIACDPRDAARRASALALATSVTARAHGAPGSFASLARDHSDCPSAAQGGVLGQIGPGDSVPEFEAALRALPEGQISAAPVPSRHGFHIIRMDRAIEGAVLPFETVRPKIRAAMERAAWVRQARMLTQELVQAADIRGADMSQFAA